MVESKKKALAKKSDLKITLPSDYVEVLDNLKNLIQTAQLKAISAVNQSLISTYRGIGQTIYEQQKTAEWGDSIVEQLAKDLQHSFPGMRGFSARNLWNMREFYLSYESNAKLQAMTAQISWTHNVVILEKCKDPLEREFYIRMSKRHGWTYRVLMNQISNKTYEKFIEDDEQQALLDKEYKELLLSELLMAAMEHDHISVRKLASAAGVSPTIIQGLKSGSKTNITIDTLSKILTQLILESDIGSE